VHVSLFIGLAPNESLNMVFILHMQYEKCI